MTNLVAIEFHNVVKKFGDFVAIKNANLKILDNEFFTLLGPSGCGKTTLLRILAGFESVTSGTALLFGERFLHLPPNQRPVNTVFQNYALFPHMTVFENVAFGLKMRGFSKDEIQATTAQMLDLVRLGQFADRTPNQLSGGQQQRAALVRAIAPKPKVLLLDEPLSALDLKLRQTMRGELKRLQKETGITFLFVTHDQEEALAMSDRIAVMSEGIVQQVGPAVEIYEKPINRIVANFIGETNLLKAEVVEITDRGVMCRVGDALLMSEDNVNGVCQGQKVCALIRPEKLHIVPCGDPSSDFRGTIVEAMYLGTDTQYTVEIFDRQEISVRIPNGYQADRPYEPGTEVSLKVSESATQILRD